MASAIHETTLKEFEMLIKKFSLFALAILFAGSALAAEPGSGYYARDCVHPGGGYNITINKDGTAMVETDPDVYENVMTSYSFFGNDTPSDFLVAIMFDEKNSPIPSYKGQSGWIEIWKTDKGYSALENGRASKELKHCASN
jgi:hypothetical protein